MAFFGGPVLPAGTILHYPVDFGEPGGVLPHFVVIVECDGVYYKTLIIKSAPTEWQEQKSDQMKHLVTIDQRSHTFLTHDSKVNCTYLHPIRVQDIRQYLREKPKEKRGLISIAVKRQIVQACKDSKLLSPADKESILKAFP